MERGSKGAYVNLSPEDFIKWLGSHRGGHAFQLKQCAQRWVQNNEKNKRKENHE